MYYEKLVKPWLRVVFPYKEGRHYEIEGIGAGRITAWGAGTGGWAECLACPELGEKEFRKRHTLARFIRQHRHCGKPGVAYLPARRSA